MRFKRISIKVLIYISKYNSREISINRIIRIFFAIDRPIKKKIDKN